VNCMSWLVTSINKAVMGVWPSGSWLGDWLGGFECMDAAQLLANRTSWACCATAGRGVCCCQQLG
jgi:hypothetical protein